MLREAEAMKRVLFLALGLVAIFILGFLMLYSSNTSADLSFGRKRTPGGTSDDYVREHGSCTNSAPVRGPATIPKNGLPAPSR